MEKCSNTKVASQKLAIPSSWSSINGVDRASSLGYTIWRDWDEEDWINVLLSHDSYSGKEEVVPAWSREVETRRS